jgi:hypothetical protein
VFAKNSLVLRHIEKISRQEETKDEPNEDGEEEDKDDQGFFVPIGCGRMLCSEIPQPL